MGFVSDALFPFLMGLSPITLNSFGTLLFMRVPVPFVIRVLRWFLWEIDSLFFKAPSSCSSVGRLALVDHTEAAKTNAFNTDVPLVHTSTMGQHMVSIVGRKQFPCSRVGDILGPLFSFPLDNSICVFPSTICSKTTSISSACLFVIQIPKAHTKTHLKEFRQYLNALLIDR